MRVEGDRYVYSKIVEEWKLKENMYYSSIELGKSQYYVRLQYKDVREQVKACWQSWVSVLVLFQGALYFISRRRLPSGYSAVDNTCTL